MCKNTIDNIRPKKKFQNKNAIITRQEFLFHI